MSGTHTDSNENRDCAKLETITPLNDAQRNKLLRFQGYGNPAVPFWFIGMEEGSGGKNEDLPQNLEARLSFSEIMDLRVAHNEEHLFFPYWDKNNPYWNDKRYWLPSVWLYMARFVRALNEGAQDWWDTQKAKDYVRCELGRKHGKTFLTELLPLPKRGATDWPPLYQQLFSFDTREIYRNAVLNSRINLLQQLIQKYRPNFLLCYGGTNHDDYKKLVRADSWKSLPVTKFELGESDSTQVILSPFMGNGQMSRKWFIQLIGELRKA